MLVNSNSGKEVVFYSRHISLGGKFDMFRLSCYQSHNDIMAWHGMAWHGMAWHGMAWHGVAWRGMAWHVTGRYRPYCINDTHANRAPCCCRGLSRVTCH